MKLVTLARGQTGSPGVVLSDGTYLDLGTAERVVGEADAGAVVLSGTVMGILAAEQLQDVRRLVGLVEEGSGEMRAALKAAGSRASCAALRRCSLGRRQSGIARAACGRSLRIGGPPPPRLACR